ncbi:MAG: universal stress protein [Acidobacteria bacterium]|nr:universal stress protein [Acidobacteriota bacterium]
MKILIATDGSEFSERAVTKACELVGTAADRSVKIISVYEPQTPAAAEPFALSGEYYQKLAEFARERAEQSAAAAVRLVEESCPQTLAAVTSEVELGRPSQVIIDKANEWKADLIIVGSHGRGFWSRLTLGSVSDAVVHHAECSVLVVK